MRSEALKYTPTESDSPNRQQADQMELLTLKVSTQTEFLETYALTRSGHSMTPDQLVGLLLLQIEYQDAHFVVSVNFASTGNSEAGILAYPAAEAE